METGYKSPAVEVYPCNVSYYHQSRIRSEFLLLSCKRQCNGLFKQDIVLLYTDWNQKPKKEASARCNL